VAHGILERTRAQLSDPVERARIVGEVWKFGVVGVGGVVIDFAFFNLFEHEGIGPLTAGAFSNIIAAVLSYFANRHWAFAHRARTGLRRELPIFILLSSIGLGINEVPLAISHYALDYKTMIDDDISRYTIGLALATLFRFWSFKRWVFTPEAHDDEVLASAAV
jgi:putative flippase GtrA